MSLTTRMLAPIALIMSIALAFVAGSAYDNAKKIVSSNIVTIEATVVEAVSREIEFMIESTRNYMRLSAQRQIVKQYAEWLLTQKKPDRSAPEQKIFLEQINQSVAIYNYVDSLIFLHKQGTVEASTENMGEGQNRSDREYYREAMLGKSSVQGPLITRTKGYYAFFLGEPVFVNGEVSGVLVGAINMDYIASHTIDPVTMHGKGIVYVVDPNGQIILHPDRQKMIGNAMIEQAILEAISDGGAGSFENERDGMAYYSTFNTLPNGWTVIATVSRDFMMSDVQLMRDRTVAVALAAVCIALFFMFLVVCRVVAAMRKGVQFAESVAEGNLDQTFNIRRNDELGALASALNTMVGKLKNSFEIANRQTREAEEARARATSTYRELQALIDSVDGGVARFALDDSFRVIWANTGFYALSGRTREDYARDVGNRGINVVHPEDGLTMLKTFREHAQKNDSLKAEYRILRKDGGTSWIYLRAKRVGEWEGYPLFQGVFIDITQQKNIIRALEMEQQRYNVVTEITEEILFEQDIATDILTFSSNFEKLFNRPRSIEHYLRDKHFLEIVHPDDLHLLPSTRSTELSEDDFMRFDARLLTSENTYQWFTICFKVLRDNAGKPTNVIGRLSNINDKKLEEDRLRREAQTDMLTGLYNKMTFKQLAEDMLSEGTHALIIVDIDDFKNVNDTYGHLFGDEVILTVASVVRDGFRSSDITGRIGGDEFAVFARDALDENVIRNRCRQITARLADIDYPNGYRISVSMGISFYPRHGKDYPTLFSHADAALYHLKKHRGKGGYAVYGE